MFLQQTQVDIENDDPYAVLALVVCSCFAASFDEIDWDVCYWPHCCQAAAASFQYTCPTHD